MTRRGVWLWLPVGVYMATIFILSSLPAGPELPGILGWDKLKHFVAYAGLAAVVARSFRSGNPGWRLSTLILASVGVSSAYGVTDEIHQHFVPTRCCDLADWIADVLGSATGATLAAVLYLRRR